MFLHCYGGQTDRTSCRRAGGYEYGTVRVLCCAGVASVVYGHGAPYAYNRARRPHAYRSGTSKYQLNVFEKAGEQIAAA